MHYLESEFIISVTTELKVHTFRVIIKEEDHAYSIDSRLKKLSQL